MSGAVVLVVAAIILALLATIVGLSFSRPNGGLEASLASYREVFSSPVTYQVLGNSIVFAAVSLLVAFAFGLPIAWLVECSDLRGKTVAVTLMLVTLLIPGFAAAAGWQFLIHPRIGLINIWLMRLTGMTSAPFNLLTLAGMGWVEGLTRVPLVFVMTSAAFRAMDRSLEEAALTSGAPARAVLARIVLPLVRPALAACALYVAMIGFGSFDVPAIIGWSNRIFTFSTYIYLLTNPQDVFPGYGPAAALSTAMLAVALLVVGWMRRTMRDGHRFAVVTGKAYRPRLTKLGPWRFAGWALVGAYLVLALGLPILVLVWASLIPFIQLPSANAFALVSFANYRALPWDLFLTGMTNTALLAFLVPPLVLAVSFLFSWLGFRSRMRGRELLDQLAFVPHAVPHIVLGMGLLLLSLFVLQTVLPIYGTRWLLLLAFTITWLSYGTRITNTGLVAIHRELEESARISGAGTFELVRRITLPLMSRGLLLAWVYLGILTARELTLSVLLTTPGNITAPVVIWSIWLTGGLGRASAGVICFLVAVLPLMAAYVVLLQRAGRPAALAGSTPS